MSRVTVKLFREPEEAEKALSALKAKGYRAEEVGILMSERMPRERLAGEGMPEARGVSLAGVGPVIALGATAATLSSGAAPETSLAKLWNIPEETSDYYQSALSFGGVLVSVHAEESRAAEAQNLLRAASPRGERAPMWSSSPGFVAASRMSETNPIDAPMSGDFRRY